MITVADKLSKLSPEQRALLEKKLYAKRQTAQNHSRITPRANQKTFPLSAGQQRLWYLEQMDQDSSAYNITEAYHLKGTLALDQLTQSLTLLCGRHETLRSRFETIDGEPIQFVESKGKADVTYIDLRDHAPADRLDHAARLATNSDNQPFDLAIAPLWRVIVAQLAENENVLIFTLHHMIADGWSLGLFTEELSQYYATLGSGTPVDATDLPIQFADYAAWQSEWLAGKHAEKQLAYWSEKLAGLTEPLTLPVTKQEAGSLHRGMQANHTLSQQLINSAQQLCQQNDISLFVLLLSAFEATLYRYTAQQEMVVCTPIASRRQLELEQLIGYFNNIVALRSSLTAETTFDGLLHQNNQVVLDAYKHQDLPFHLVAELPNLTRVPLSRALIVLADHDGPALSLPGITVDSLSFSEDSADFDWSLFLSRTPDGLRCELVYKSGLFSEEVAQTFLHDFQLVITQSIANSTIALPELTIDGKYVPLASLNSAGFVDDASYEAPIGEHEGNLAAVWCNVFGLEKIGRNQNFFELGGHSMLAVRLFAQIRELTGDNLPLSILFESPTIRELAKQLTPLPGSVPDALTDAVKPSNGTLLSDTPNGNIFDNHARQRIVPHALADDEPSHRRNGVTGDELVTAPGHKSAVPEWSPLVMINRGRAENRPFYCVHGAGGNVLNFRDLAQQIGKEVPFYGLQARGIDGVMKPHSTIAEIADCYLEAILLHQPEGPYRLGGYSGGGIVALEIAQRLQRRGAKVEVLAMIDTIRPDLEEQRVSLGYHMQHLSRKGTTYITEWVKERFDYRRLAKEQTEVIEQAIANNEPVPIEARDWHLTTSFWAALDKHNVAHYSGETILFAAEEVWATLRHLGDDKGWHEVIPHITVRSVPGDHDTLVSGENVKVIAQWLRTRLL